VIRYRQFSMRESRPVGKPNFLGYQATEWIYPNLTAFYDAVAAFASELGHRLFAITNVTAATDTDVRCGEYEKSEIVVWYLEEIK
jgi:hypothetical protein